MQIKHSPQVTFKQNSTQKADNDNKEISSGLQTYPASGYAANSALPTTQNYKALFLNKIGTNKQGFGHSLDSNLTSWGVNVTPEGSQFKVWAKWAKQVFVQAVPADSPDPNSMDNNLQEWKKEFPWYQGANKVPFTVRDKESGKESILNVDGHKQIIENDIDKKQLIIPDSKKDKEIWELHKVSNDGVFESDRLPEIKPGYKYRYIFTNPYVIEKKENNETVKKHVLIVNYKQDPTSYQLDNVDSWTTVVDHNSFDWGEQTRKKTLNGNVLHSPDTRAFMFTHDKGNASQIKIEKIHIGTVSEKGDYESAKKYINTLAKKHPGLTHIELLPLETTYSTNWGYDGTATGKFAPTPHYVKGTKLAAPEALKDLIKHAQNKGLGVIIDMVPNHYSHDFAGTLEKFAPYQSTNEKEKAECQWGRLYKFEGEQSDRKRVRDFVTRMALNWIVNYNANGLRLDMTKVMHSKHAMKQLSQEVRYHVPDAIIIAEDGNDDALGMHCAYEVTAPLRPEEASPKQTLRQHIASIGKTIKNESDISNIGYDAQWGFHLQHSLFVLLSGEPYPMNSDRYKPDIHKLETMFKDPQANTNIIYPISHDEIGNFEGARLISKMTNYYLNMPARVKLEKIDGQDNPDRNLYQVAATAVQNMMETYYSKGFCYKDPKNAEHNKKWEDYQKNITWKEKKIDDKGNITYHDKVTRVTFPVTLSDFRDALNHARACHKLALGTTFAYPAPKMMFQGDEYGTIQPFYFFRNEPAGNRGKTYHFIRDKEKGYDYMLDDPKAKPANTFDAYERSKLKRTGISRTLADDYNKMEAYEQKLERITLENPALQENNSDPQHLQTFVYDNNDDQVLQVHRTDTRGNSVLMVMNFGNKEYNEFYLKPNKGGNMPTKGSWKEEINSDDTAYGGSGKFVTRDAIKAEDDGRVKVKIPKKGFIILCQKGTL